MASLIAMMGAAPVGGAKAKGPFQVSRCEPMDRYLYLAHGATKAVEHRGDALPAIGGDSIRVVCISDTHNEHDTLRLPAGDLLIHSGDCLTESGTRHVVRSNGVIQSVKPDGEALFVHFSQWLGAQPYCYKILVAGNHDLVLQGLGKAKVQEILDAHTTHGKVIYLQHEAVSAGGVNIFGSPFAYWGGKNDAFLSRRCDFTDVPAGMHIVVTHMPAILPAEGGALDEDMQMTNALHKTGASLHVSGHCHWAFGVYHSRRQGSNPIPCVVASVCDSQWLFANSLTSVTGVRGDSADRRYGGYNLLQPGVVCDIRLPGGRPALFEDTVPTPTSPTASTTSFADERGYVGEAAGKNALLFFGPPNDPALVRNLLPQLREIFDVDWVDSASDGVEAIKNRSYVAVVAKLGTEGNLGVDIISALRQSQGSQPFVAIHSATAMAKPDMCSRLKQEPYCCNLVMAHGCEQQLLDELAAFSGTAADSAGKSCVGAATKQPTLLVFGPPNDRQMVKRLLPKLKDKFCVTHVESAAEGVEKATCFRFDACIAKLGTEGNLGVDVIGALRDTHGAAPFVAIHSGTAAGNPELRSVLENQLNVNLFVDADSEDMLLNSIVETVSGCLRS